MKNLNSMISNSESAFATNSNFQEVAMAEAFIKAMEKYKRNVR